jgi:hypothetical protein
MLHLKSQDQRHKKRKNPSTLIHVQAWFSYKYAMEQCNNSRGELTNVAKWIKYVFRLGWLAWQLFLAWLKIKSKFAFSG